MYGQDILCGISKDAFEIPHKIYCPDIERCVIYTQVEFQERFDLRALNHFLNNPLACPSRWKLKSHESL